MGRTRAVVLAFKSRLAAVRTHHDAWGRGDVQPRSRTGGLREDPVEEARRTIKATRLFAAPRLRQSLSALGCGYGLNKKEKALRLRAKLKVKSLAALGSGYGA